MVSNYYSRLVHRVERLVNYKNQPIKLSVKLIWWMIRHGWKNKASDEEPKIEHAPVMQPEESGFEMPTSAKAIRIAVYDGGGIGDALIQTLYIRELKKSLSCDSSFDFYCKVPASCQHMPFIDNVYSIKTPINRRHYDAVIISRRFYSVDMVRPDRLKRLAPKFYDFCEKQEALRKKLGKTFFNDNLLTQYALIFGKARLEQANTLNLLPISQASPYFMTWEKTAENILEKCNLKIGRYITLSRAVGTVAKAHPKLWPIEHYEALVRSIKAHYPDYVIVQLGAADTPTVIHGIDMNLVGKTTLEESKVLLKYSAIHVDIEGGLVHMRRALNGRSVVIFGPTSEKVFGYKQNLNLRSDACQIPCEWVTDEWTETCLKANDETALCQRALRPDRVFGAVQQALDMFEHSIDSSFKYRTVKSLSDIPIKSDARIIQVETDVQTTHALLKVAGDRLFKLYGTFEQDGIHFEKRVLASLGITNVELDFGAILNLPFDDQTLDVIAISPVAFRCISDFEKFEFELRRVLSPNGLALVRITEPITVMLQTVKSIDTKTGWWLIITKE